MTLPDSEKYSLSFGVSYVEILAIVTEILVFYQGCTTSPVSILKIDKAKQPFLKIDM